MPYRYLEGITSADFAFEATGATIQELLQSAADAVLALMVEDPERLSAEVERVVDLKTEMKDPQAAVASLLHMLLQRIIYYKDAERAFLRPAAIEIIGPESGKLELHCVLRGERIDPKRQALGTDVKGVTYHHYKVTRNRREWKATVVVDT